MAMEKAVGYTPRAAIGGARFITDAITQTDRDRYLARQSVAR
jgi:hypothetical protein